MFDLPRFLDNSRRIDTSDFNWDDVPKHPLKLVEVRFLRYMMNIEDHTIVYLKELLGTNVIRDPEVTAFLSCWAYEEYWHGATLQKFLRAYHGDDTLTQDVDYRFDNEGRIKRRLKAMIAPLLAAATPDFAAAHMTWGAMNERSTLTGYEALAAKTEHPILRELMHRIVKDERRHFAFYHNQAAIRLGAHKRNRRMTRRMMDRLWRPVGTGVWPAADIVELSRYLFHDRMDDIRDVDADIARLPGMDGWRGLEDAINEALADPTDDAREAELLRFDPPQVLLPAR